MRDESLEKKLDILITRDKIVDVECYIGKRFIGITSTNSFRWELNENEDDYDLLLGHSEIVASASEISVDIIRCKIKVVYWNWNILFTS